MEWTQEHFNSAKGAVNMGRDFEAILPARIGLNLVLNEKVDNFKLFSNVKEMGKFDDIVLEINGHRKYGIQLKDKAKLKSLCVQSVQLILNTHYESYCNDVKNKTDLKTIIIEKMSSDVESLSLKINSKTVTMQKTKKPPKFLSDFKVIKSYYFDAKKDDKVDANLRKFLNSFLFVIIEDDNKTIKYQILEDIAKCFKISVNNANKYIEFVEKWYRNPFKVVLNKPFLQLIIALQVLKIFLPDCKGARPSAKEKLFFKTITDFNITVFSRKRLNQIKKLMVNATCLIELNQYNDVLRDYQLSAYTEIQQKIIVMWLEKKIPLVVTNKCNNKIIEMISSYVKLILISPYNEQILPEQTFQTLNDLKLTSSSYNEILNLFQCKLQGKIISLRKLRDLSDKVLTLTTRHNKTCFSK